jgi:hypothetical protein
VAAHNFRSRQHSKTDGRVGGKIGKRETVKTKSRASGKKDRQTKEKRKSVRTMMAMKVKGSEHGDVTSRSRRPRCQAV